ncbi:MAG: hypothetical protein WBW76_02660 [Candidatus Cybelea sp.]
MSPILADRSQAQGGTLTPCIRKAANDMLRPMIRRFLSATILGCAAIPLGATSAEPPVTHQDVTRNWADAWNSHSIGKVLALFAKDIQIDQPENDKPSTIKVRGSFSL